MFGEPAWDILLALYVCEQDGLHSIASSVAALIGVPLTSTFRWIDYLESQHLINRESDKCDKRAVIARLTDNGRAALEGYLSETLRDEL